jgi:hypothetical protein
VDGQESGSGWACCRLDLHDSSSGLFSVDRFSPTFREVLQKPFDVSAFQRLYAPLDANGNREQTINERVHGSVIGRYGKSASVYSVDADGTCGPAVY